MHLIQMIKMPHNFSLVAVLISGLLFQCAWARPQYRPLPPLREQAEIYDDWRQERIAKIPDILTKYDTDAWLMSQLEYAEETVFWSLKSFTQFSARRRTVQLFFASHLSSSDTQNAYTWIDNTPKLWDDVREVLAARNPKSINVDGHLNVSFSSGLHLGEWDWFSAELKDWSSKFQTQPMIAVEYIATMPESQLAWYRRFMETAWAIISEGFSERVIVPDETTTTDVEWWMREKIQYFNYTTWFHPSVTILPSNSPVGEPDALNQRPITYGDLLHVDFGVTAMGLNTDTQHLAYVLPPGHDESQIPRGYLDGLKKANDLQDITRSSLRPGQTGNEVLANIKRRMRDYKIDGRVYSHPIGDWGHSAGALVGMTNLQDGVPVLGDLPVLENMYYSVELFAEHFVPERNATVKFYLEEDVYWDVGSYEFDWVHGRQEKFHVIKSPAKSPQLTIQI